MKNMLPIRMARHIYGFLAPAMLFSVSAADIEWNGRTPAEINAAVQQCQVGDTLLLPQGNFSINEPIRIKSGIKLIGKGQGKIKSIIGSVWIRATRRLCAGTWWELMMDRLRDMESK